MKAIIKSLVVLAASQIFFNACTSLAPPRTIVHGKIDNYEGGVVRMEFYSYNEDSLKDDMFALSVPIDSTGYFYLETTEISHYYLNVWTHIGPEFKGMSVAPGDSIFIALDANEFDESITFSGRGAAKNNYRAWRYLEYEDVEMGVDLNYIRGLPYEEFLVENDKIKQNKLSALDSIYEGQPKDLLYEMEPKLIEFNQWVSLALNQKQNGYQNVEEIKKYFRTASIDFTAWSMYGDNRFDTFNLVKLLAGRGATDFELYQAALINLDERINQYFVKYDVPYLLAGHDGEMIMNDIAGQSIGRSLLRHLEGYYTYLQALDRNHPNKPAGFRAFGESFEPDSMIITGHFLNQPDEKDEVEVYDYGILTKHLNHAEVAENGFFELRIPTCYSREVLFTSGMIHTPIMIHPGDHLHLEISNNQISYFGDGAQEARKIQSFLNEQPGTGGATALLMHQYVQPKNYKDKILAMIKHRSELARSFFGSGEPAWLTKWVENLAYGELYDLHSYEDFRSHFHEELTEEFEPLPSDFYDLTGSIPELTKFTWMINDLDDVMRRLFRSNDKINLDIDAPLFSIEKGLQHLEGLEFDLLIGYVVDNVCLDDIDASAGFLEKFGHKISTPGLRKALNVNVQRRIDHLAGLSVPAGADLNELPTDDGDSLLQSIIAKHQGKTIYLDIWATWCGPCLGEFEYAEAFHDKIDHDKVALVYLAGHSKEKSWKEKIAEHRLQGDHYLLSESQYSSIAARLESPGFPTYAIIDKDGIIKYKSAPRPSVHQQELNEHLINMLNTM